MTRVLDLVFFLYFATHVPISILVDFQSLFPSSLYPQILINVKNWYCATFRDPMMMVPPAWFKSLVTSELFLQLPFFPIATYGFFKGAKKCQWLRLPIIVYGTHVATTLIPIMSHILFHDFRHEPIPGPDSIQERLFLISVYSVYFIIPVLLVLDGLFSSVYTQKFANGNSNDSRKKKKK